MKGSYSARRYTMKRHIETRWIIVCLSLAPLVFVAATGCVNRTVLHGNGVIHYLSTSSPNLNGNIQQQHNSSGQQAGNSTKPAKLVVWFVKPQRAGLVLTPVLRPDVSQISISTAVSELLAGPTPQEAGNGFTSEIPKGILLLKVDEQGNTVDLNLSRRFASGGGTSSFTTRLAQLSKTVAGVAGGRKVYLDIEGKRLNETTGDGIEVRQPIN